MCITLHANVGFIIDIGASSGDFPPLEHARLVDNSLVGDFTGLLSTQKCCKAKAQIRRFYLRA
jgi:hypothetical protein